MNNKIIKNIKIAKYIIVITNLLSAILFSYSYILIHNNILLVPIIINLVVAVIAYFLFSYFEKKFMNNSNMRDLNGK